MIKQIIFVLVVLGLISCTDSSENTTHADNNSNKKVLLSSKLKWEKLNPARGDKSPQAADLWGNRKEDVATGFLVKFVDGFSSPPHIHNVSYRALVLKGEVHNDDPAAANMWMKPGSFWTQPAGESHITSARGNENIAFVEIDSGPYLVEPIDSAFDNGERPINIDIGNMVWQDTDNESVKIAYLWGQANGRHGVLLKIKEGYTGIIANQGDFFKAVLISGTIDYSLKEKNLNLEPGSSFSSEGENNHSISVSKSSLIYISTNDKIITNE